MKIKYKTILKCSYCLSQNIFYDEQTYKFATYKAFNKSNTFKCKFCGELNQIHKKYIVMSKEIKMKIDNVKEEEIQTGNSLPEETVFTAEEIEKSDFELKDLTDNSGMPYKRWIMTMEDKTEYNIPNCVMQGFKELREKKRSEIEISKTGTGLSTKYGITFTK